MIRRHRRCRKNLRNRAPRRSVSPEWLEDRLLLSGADIQWVNRGDDDFEDVFGGNAEMARNVVDASINAWERVIVSFNDPENDDDVFELTVEADADNSGCGGSAETPGVDNPANGIPDEGHLNINACSSPGWWLDPTPAESSEFLGVIVNAFAGDAPLNGPPGSPCPAGMGCLPDLFAVVTAEMLHVLGIAGDEDFLLEDYNDNTPPFGDTGIADAAVPGTLWTFDFQTGGVQALFTDNNGCSTGEDTDEPLHIAEPNANNMVTEGGVTFFGAQDAGNACAKPGRRSLPSVLDARILAEVYAYSIPSPSSFPNFYVHLDAQGNLLVRGGSPGQGAIYGVNTADSNDEVILMAQDGNLVVKVGIGSDVPGTALNTTMHFESSFPLSAINSIRIFGHDSFFNDVDGDMVRDDDGDDYIILDFTGGNIVPPDGIQLDAGTGENILLVQGASDISAYSITDESIYVGGKEIAYANTQFVNISAGDALNNTFLVIGTHSSVDNLFLGGGSHEDQFIVNNTSDSLEVLTLAGFDGDDTFQVDNVPGDDTLIELVGGSGNDEFWLTPLNQDLDHIAPNEVRVIGDDGDDKLFLMDNQDTGPETFHLRQISALQGEVQRGNSFLVDYAFIETLELHAGIGETTVYVQQTMPGTRTFVDAGAGDDAIFVDSSAEASGSNVNGVVSELFISGGAFGHDTLLVDDRSEDDPNTVTVNGVWIGADPGDDFFGSGGMIWYDKLDELTIRMGRGGDTIQVQGTAPGTPTTIYGSDGLDHFFVAGPSNLVDDSPDGDRPRRVPGVVEFIQSMLTLEGDSGADTLVINDAAATIDKDVTVTEETVGKGPADNFFGAGGGLVYHSMASMLLELGSGNDNVFVHSTFKETSTGVQVGSGEDTITVQNPLGTVDTIVSALTVHGESGPDHLIVNDSSDLSHDTVTITATQVGVGTDTFFGTGGTLTYADLSELTVKTGSANDLVTVLGTAAGTETTVNAGVGSDQVLVDSNGTAAGGVVNQVLSRLVVDGGDAMGDSLYLTDVSEAFSTTVTITESEVGAAMGDTFFGLAGSLGYSNLTQIQIETGTNDDVVAIRSTHPGTALAVLAGDGTNLFLVDSNGVAAGGTVDGIASPLALIGGSGLNAVFLDDTDDATGDTITLHSLNPQTGQIGTAPADDFFGPGGRLTYAQIDNVFVRTGSAADAIHLHPAITLVGTAFSIFGQQPAFSDPIPGDVLHLDLLGVAIPKLTVTGFGSGKLTSPNHAPVSYAGIELIDRTAGPRFDVVVDTNVPILGGNDSVEDRVEAMAGSAGGEKTLELRVNAQPAFVGVESSINSLTVLGSTDPDAFVVIESTDGLPTLGGSAPTGHTNPAFVNAALVPANVSVQYDGGPGMATDLFELILTAPHNVSEFPDVVATANSGVVNVEGAFTLSYESLTPIDIQGTGGSLHIDASLLAGLTRMTLTDLGGGLAEVDGDGGFERTTFQGFDSFSISPPARVPLGRSVGIGGHVFEDRNGNGRKDADDRGIAGFLIELDARADGRIDATTMADDLPLTDDDVARNADGRIDATTMTDASGLFAFRDLPPGVYEVISRGQVGSDTEWKYVNVQRLLVFLEHSLDESIDFAVFEPSTLRGFTFLDFNGDGEKDADDLGLAGVLIQVDGMNGQGVPVTVSTTSADDDPATRDSELGAYQIDLGPGIYSVDALAPEISVLSRGPVQISVLSGEPPRILGEASSNDLQFHFPFAAASLLDFGDAPDDPQNASDFPTLLASGGARHVMIGPFLGSSRDGESDGSPSVSASFDDLLGSSPDDEDGVTFTSPLAVGEVATVEVVASGAGELSAWVDFNDDGDWSDPKEQIFSDEPLVGGTNVLTFPVPLSAKPTDRTFVRFRFAAHVFNMTFAGLAPNGEVEDYAVRIHGVDWGDAPNEPANYVAEQVADISPGPDSSSLPTELTEFNGNLFFSAAGPQGRELYRVDSNSTVSSVANINPGAADSSPHYFTEFNGNLYFSADGPLGVELYRVDSTNAVSLVADINPGAGDSKPKEFDEFNGNLFFGATGPQGRELYRVDASNTVSLVADINAGMDGSGISDFTPGYTEFNGSLFFVAAGPQGRELYRVDSSNSVNQVADLNPGTADSFPQENTEFDSTEFNGNLFFGAIGPQGRELYRVDAGNSVSLVADINPGVDHSFPSGFTEFNGNLFFSASGPQGDELYRVDSSNAVSQVADINPGADDSRPGEFTEFNGNLFFSAIGPQGGELYRVGSSNTVSLVADINPAADDERPGEFTEFNGNLFFSAIGPQGDELYRVDSINAVSLVADINPGAADSEPSGFTEFNGCLFFSARGPDGRELYKVANATYPTRRCDNGARHVIFDGWHLGAAVDRESNGKPSDLAHGDDNSGATPDDEDSVTFTSQLVVGQMATAIVHASASGLNFVPGLLNAWLDFNGDGDWNDAGEQIAQDLQLFAGANTLQFVVPLTAKPTDRAFARFRFSTASGLLPVGPAPDGEVEDHFVPILGMDFGDAPDDVTDPLDYPTLHASGFPFHFFDGTLRLGAAVDHDVDGQPSASADGDDNAGTPDDEDGVEFVSSLVPGQFAAIKVTVQGTGFLNAWIDFNADKDWADPGEQIATHLAVSTGPKFLSFTVPSSAALGTTYARFRLDRKGVLSFSGLAEDGEMEDYQIKITATGDTDFGDAPDRPFNPGFDYKTHLLRDGARHKLGSALFLGATVDAETVGLPSIGAIDDDNTELDDEDGVTFLTALTSLPTDSSASVSVVASAPGLLDAWIDFNGNRTFDHSSEHIGGGASIPLVAGPNTVNFTVPGNAASGTTYARFRVSSSGGLLPTGEAADGEVEDYAVEIIPTADLEITQDDSVDPVVAGSGTGNLIYTVTVTNHGPADASDIVIEEALSMPAGVMLQFVTASLGDASSFMSLPDPTYFWTIDSLPSGASATLTLGMTVASSAAAGLNTICNMAAVTAVNEPDSDASNNSATECTSVKREVDLGVTKTDSDDPVLAGSGPGNLIYTVTVTNVGPSDASAVLVNEVMSVGPSVAGKLDETAGGLPANVTVGSVGPSVGTFHSDTGVWALGSLASGASETLRLVLTVGASKVEQLICNTATVDQVIEEDLVDVVVEENHVDLVVETDDLDEFIDSDDECTQVFASLDFGDTLDSYGTTLAADGARHVIGDLLLGGVVDADFDGQPNFFATGDDLTEIDDEDGVTFGTFVAGTNGVVNITSSGAGFVNAWLDLNINGVFDPNEQILVDKPVVAGLNIVAFPIPATAIVDIVTRVRFRLNSPGGLGPTGPATDGEVEDYSGAIAAVVLPEPGGGDGGNGGFSFIARPNVRWWYDPAIAQGYDFVVTSGGGELFETAELPVVGDNQYTIHLPDGIGGYQAVGIPVMGGPDHIIDLRTLDPVNFPNGLPSYRVLGIDSAAMLNPADPLAFPAGLTFFEPDTATPGTFTMTPIPETIYADLLANYLLEMDNDSSGGITPGDQVTWQGIPLLPGDDVSGLIFGATAFDSLAAALNAVVCSCTNVEIAPALSNQVPQASVSGPTVGVRGQPRTLLLQATDSAADEATGFGYTINWGDGTPPEMISPTSGNGTGTPIDHVYTQSGNYAVEVTATDQFGAVSSMASHSITISALALEPDPEDPSKTALALGGRYGNDVLFVGFDARSATLVSPTTTGTEIIVALFYPTLPASESVFVFGTFTVRILMIPMSTPFSRLMLFGQDGDDILFVGPFNSIPAEMDGGKGNDFLWGGSSDDIMIGGDGDDIMFGGAGRDVMFGGFGSDKMHGEGGDDLMVGASTVFDDNWDALRAIRSEWTRTDLDYGARIEHLSGGAGGLNGAFVLNNQTVIDDGVVDVLIGGSGQDWFFADQSGAVTDLLLDQVAAEIAVDIGVIP